MIISPSLLSANFANLEKDIASIEATKAEWLHYDVMDGHFVPNISFGYSILGDVKKITDLFLDVHLMISDPLKYINEFVKNGADLITFHYECYEDKAKVLETIKMIKDANVKVGLSIKPNTTVSEIEEYLPLLDLVLVMSVEPGFGGQSFMPISLDKISALRELIDSNHYSCLIEVDGGINQETAKLVKEAGCDVAVAGSYVFKQIDRNEAVNSLL